VIVAKPKRRELNRVRRTTTKWYYVDSAALKEFGPEFPFRIAAAPVDAPWTSTHIALVLTHKKNEELRFAAEFFKDHVRIIPNEKVPMEKAGNGLAVAKLYREQGIRFLWSQEGLHLSLDYRISHVLINPSLADFSQLGIAHCLLSSLTPFEFCTTRRPTLQGEHRYHPNYYRILVEENDSNAT